MFPLESSLKTNALVVVQKENWAAKFEKTSGWDS